MWASVARRLERECRLEPSRALGARGGGQRWGAEAKWLMCTAVDKAGTSGLEIAGMVPCSMVGGDVGGIGTSSAPEWPCGAGECSRIGTGLDRHIAMSVPCRWVKRSQV